MDLKRLANSQEGEDRHGTAPLNHLPVADAEAVGNHILLAQLAVGSVGPDAVAKSAEELCIVGRKISVGTHLLRVGPTRAKIPRTKRRID